MSELVARIENLSPARQKLLARLNAKAASDVRSYPLAFVQRGLWFIHQLETDSPLYNMPVGNRYIGPLDALALWRAIREIVQRHESLRTIFPARNGVAVQEVLQESGFEEQVIDLSLLPARERDTKLQQLLKELALRPFNLARGPIFRVALFKLSEQEHVLFFNVHHIVSDGWSLSILERELDTLYRAYAQGRQSSPLPPLELRYGDYAIWQRGWLKSGVMQRQLDFWKAQLADVAEVVLPTDYERPTVLLHRGRSVSVDFSREISARVMEFCRNQSATPFMAFLAIFELAIARYMGVTDFTVGTPIANRNRLETEGIIGCFINTLVLRSDVRQSQGFRQLLARVRERTLTAYEHQELPFEKLVEELVPIQNLSRTPLFQAFFTFQNFPATRAPRELQQAEVDVGLGLTKFEMMMTVAQHEAVFRAHLEYDVDLFRDARMESFVEYFRLTLEAVMAQPDCESWSSSLLPECERRQLRQWSKGQDARVESLVVERFEQLVARRPEAAAVSAEMAHASYEMLNRRANQLAWRLATLGITAEATVGVLLERSVDLHAAVLGIFKAGGVYVPMDPTYPAERLAFIAADAVLKVLLVDERTRALAPAGPWRLLDLTAQNDELLSQPTNNPRNALHDEQLAYVIYTSGSTGRPKGVGISHRSLASQLQWASRQFALSAEDRFLQKASISFDSSIEEILAPLLSGASVVAARPRGEYDVQYLADLVAREAITCIDLSPSLLEALMEFAEPEGWRNVRLVISGGEVLRPELAKVFQDRFAATLLNTYGPTEATVQATWSDTFQDGGAVPIGRALDNTQLYVLDERMELAPVGTRGELYIGGEGVARGYVNRPRLTAERFVPNPFDGCGRRLYRTGDQVKWRADGQLVFLGRNDHQIKLRGYRIELDEIERVLKTHPGVQQAAVVVREDRPAMRQLVAYIVPDSAEDSDTRADALRTYLLQRLPAHMVPAAFAMLQALPLTHSGKLDRNSLPPPGPSAFAVQAWEAPQGATEHWLAQVFAEVLQTARVGRHGNFFELGGHSLLALKIISRIQSARHRRIPLRRLFESPSVAQMAAWLDEEQPTCTDLPTGVIELKKGTAGTPLFLIHPVGGTVFCYVELSRALPERQAVYGLETVIEAQGAPASLQSLAATYIQRIRAVQASGPYHLGGWSLGGLIAWEMARQLTAQGEVVSLLAMIDTYPPVPPLLQGESESPEARQRRVISLLRADISEGEGADGASVDAHPDEVTPLAALEAFLFQRGLVASATRQEETQRLLATYDYNVSAMQGYAMRFARQAMVLFAATDGAAEHISAQWHRYGGGQVECHSIRANHYTIMKGDAAARIGKRIGELLAPAAAAALPAAKSGEPG